MAFFEVLRRRVRRIMEIGHASSKKLLHKFRSICRGNAKWGDFIGLGELNPFSAASIIFRVEERANVFPIGISTLKFQNMKSPLNSKELSDSS